MQKNMWVLGLPIIFICSYLCADLVSILVAMQFPHDVILPIRSQNKTTGMNLSETDSIETSKILNRNFFDPEQTIVIAQDPIEEEKQQPLPTDGKETKTNQQAVKTSLDIQVLALLSVGNGKNDLSSAVIKSNRATDTYTLTKKPSFAPNVQIVRILAHRIEFLNSNKLEYAELEDFMKATETSGKTVANKSLLKKPALGGADKEPEIKQEGDTFTISKADKDNAVRRGRSLLLDINARPHLKDGMVQGLLIYNIKSNSIFQKLGLQKGDVLKSINGKTIDIKNGQELFQNFQDATELNLEIERGGVPQSLNYKII